MYYVYVLIICYTDKGFVEGHIIYYLLHMYDYFKAICCAMDATLRLVFLMMPASVSSELMISL